MAGSLADLAQTTAAMIDNLEESLADGETVTTCALIAVTQHSENGENIHLQFSSPSYLIQSGLLAWAVDAQMNDPREADEEDS